MRDGYTRESLESSPRRTSFADFIETWNPSLVVLSGGLQGTDYPIERASTIILSALVAHSAWHWMSERWSQLRQYQFRWPALDAVFWVAVMRWAILMLILGGAIWLLFGLYARFGEPRPEPEVAAAADD